MGSSDKRRRSDGMRTNLLPRQRSAPHAELPQVRHHARTEDAWVDARRPPFDRVTISLHWATVLFVLTLFASAWLHALAEARQSELTPALLQIHRASGVTVWVMAALRLTLALARYWVRFAVGTGRRIAEAAASRLRPGSPVHRRHQAQGLLHQHSADRSGNHQRWLPGSGASETPRHGSFRAVHIECRRPALRCYGNTCNRSIFTWRIQ